MVAGPFPRVKCCRGVPLTTHPLLVPWSWNNRAIPLPTVWATPFLERDHFTIQLVQFLMDWPLNIRIVPANNHSKHVTFCCVRVTSVAVEKQSVLSIKFICLAFVIRHANRVFYTPCCVVVWAHHTSLCYFIKVIPTGIRSRTVQPVVSRYTNWATGPTIYIYIYVIKWSRYRPCVAQRVGRGIAVLFHDRGTRRGWVVSSTPRPHFTPGKDPVPILQEAEWAPGPVWTCGKSRPHRDSIPDRPAHNQSLYLLSYPAQTHYFIKGKIFREKLLNSICVFWLSLQMLSQTFLILGRIKRDVIKNVQYICVHVKCPFVLPRTN